MELLYFGTTGIYFVLPIVPNFSVCQKYQLLESLIRTYLFKNNCICETIIQFFFSYDSILILGKKSRLKYLFPSRILYVITTIQFILFYFILDKAEVLGPKVTTMYITNTSFSYKKPHMASFPGRHLYTCIVFKRNNTHISKRAFLISKNNSKISTRVHHFIFFFIISNPATNKTPTHMFGGFYIG